MTGRNPEVKEGRVYCDSVGSCLAGQAPVWDLKSFHTRGVIFVVISSELSSFAK